jgi:hypothetical protein
VAAQGLGKVGHRTRYAVAPSAGSRPHVNVDTYDHGRRGLRYQMSGDGTGASAEIDRSAVVREQSRGSAGQLLALDPGDIDAWRYVQRPAAEQERAGDPGRWLTPISPEKPRLERVLVGRSGEELGCLLGGGDATSRLEPVDYGSEDGIGD